jgi:hypothetical protein
MHCEDNILTLIDELFTARFPSVKPVFFSYSAEDPLAARTVFLITSQRRDSKVRIFDSSNSGLSAASGRGIYSAASNSVKAAAE